VEAELELFTARNLTDILRLLIHIVTILRKNNVVWGVGRGSSVASYCLYLLGVHRVDSIRYDLDIKEFLK
jgi:DNA polymerase III alpha subunit